MNRQRVIVAMLAVFCVLLVLNLIKGEPEARAGEPQDPETHGPKGACCLPSGSCMQLSVSQCDAQGGTWAGPQTSCGSVDCALPRVVAAAVNSEHISGNNFGDRVWRIWSDGMVDVSVRVFVADGSCDVDAATVCGPVEVIPGMR